MRAAVLHEPLELKIEDVEEPSISEEEVLIRVMAAGICGTDIHVYRGAFPNVRFPIVPGHEFSGEIAKIGTSVERVKEGTRVIAEGSWGCGKCYFCKNGQANSCVDLRRLGRTVDGAFAQYVKVPAKSIHLLPNNVRYDEAQSIVTLACAMHALKRTNISIGDNVAILGPGHVGLLFLQIVKSVAARVLVLGIKDDRNRLKLATELGASATIDVTSTNPIEKVKELTDGKGVDVALEVSGSPTAVNQAVSMVRSDGQVLLFGTPEKLVNGFDATRVQNHELRVIGSRAGAGGYESAISMLSVGKISIAPLITHKLRLEEIARGYEIVDKKMDDVVRVVVTPFDN